MDVFFPVQDVMLLAGGNEEMTYDVSSVTMDTDFVGILPNGQKCSPWHDATMPSGHCDQCVGVSLSDYCYFCEMW